jgi:hypothetical protein
MIAPSMMRKPVIAVPTKIISTRSIAVAAPFPERPWRVRTLCALGYVNRAGDDGELA